MLSLYIIFVANRALQLGLVLYLKFLWLLALACSGLNMPFQVCFRGDCLRVHVLRGTRECEADDKCQGHGVGSHFRFHLI
jgi:hypothetical protein